LEKIMPSLGAKRLDGAKALNGPVLLGLGLVLLLGLLFWHHPLLLPLKLISVLFHEAGHALAAILCGGRVEGISVSLDESGLTSTTLPDGLLRQVIVYSSGYLGSSIAGTSLLWAFGRPRPWLPTHRIYLLLGAFFGMLATFTFHDLLSLGITLGLTILCLLAWRRGPAKLLRQLGLLFGGFVSLYALFDLRSDVLRLPWEASPEGISDAVALARLTLIPSLFWALAWTLLSLLLMSLNLRSIIFRRT